MLFYEGAGVRACSGGRYAPLQAHMWFAAVSQHMAD
jgi:hypothetical protein